jgi:hypothetical protein
VLGAANPSIDAAMYPDARSSNDATRPGVTQRL